MNDPEILNLLREIDRKQDRLTERLFGDLDHENPEARFPRLESAQRDSEDRLASLEKDRIRVYTFTAIISSILAFLAEFFIHPFRH